MKIYWDALVLTHGGAGETRFSMMMSFYVQYIYGWTNGKYEHHVDSDVHRLIPLLFHLVMFVVVFPYLYI